MINDPNIHLNPFIESPNTNPPNTQTNFFNSKNMNSKLNNNNYSNNYNNESNNNIRANININKLNLNENNFNNNNYNLLNNINNLDLGKIRNKSNNLLDNLIPLSTKNNQETNNLNNFTNNLNNITSNEMIDENINTEDNFQEFIKGEEYVNVIIVDQKSGGYTTIQKAIDDAKPYTTIKVKPGIYRESLVISTPFIEIESENPNEQAIVISTNKPTLKVEGLNSKDSIRIANLKLTNRGVFSETPSDMDFTKL